VKDGDASTEPTVFDIPSTMEKMHLRGWMEKPVPPGIYYTCTLEASLLRLSFEKMYELDSESQLESFCGIIKGYDKFYSTYILHYLVVDKYVLVAHSMEA